MKKSIAFVVLTCDSYSDLWPLYISFFQKNWENCKYDKFFITNNESIPGSNFEFIKIGKDKSWSDGLLKAISVLKNKYDYLFITLEDCPIIETVNQIKLDFIIDEFFVSEGNFLSFYTMGEMGKPTRKYNKYFGIIDKGSLYRPTCVYSLWKISVLEDLLVRDENAWEFERFGSVRSDKYDNFFMVYNNFFKVSNTVIKGKWLRSEYKRIIKLGFKPSLEKRKLNTRKEEFIFKLYYFVFKLFYKYVPIPWKIRRKIVFKIKGYNYIEVNK